MDKTRNELVIRIHGTLYSPDDISFNTSIEVADTTVDGTLTVDGNIESRNIWIRNNGNLEVNGCLTAKGDIEANDVIICGDCSCWCMTVSGYVLIAGNVKCCSITAKGDVCIDGTFSGKPEDIRVPEGCHVYIGGELVR